MRHGPGGGMPVTRRAMLGMGLAVALCPIPQTAEATRFVNRTGLRAGQFVWEPSQPSRGPVTIVVSLRHRLVHVYKAGILVGISTCEPVRGRATPTGIFTILASKSDGDEKGEFAWTGVALHARNVQRYPASLGCIKVPPAFARLLDGIVVPGTVVIMADQRTEAMDVVQSGSLFPLVPVHDAHNPLLQHVVQRPAQILAEAPDAGHVAIIFSRRSRNALLLRDGVREQVARVNFVEPNSPIGTHVYTLTGTVPGGNGLVWLAFGIGRSRREQHLVSWQGDEVLDQISFESRHHALAMSRALHLGATVIVTDDASMPQRRQTPPNFTIITSADPETRRRTASSRRSRRYVRRVPRQRMTTWSDGFLSKWR